MLVFYIMAPGEMFVQTRMPARYARQLARLAEREGLSIAALLRRMVMQAVEQNQEPLISAWTLPAEAARNPVAVREAVHRPVPPFCLGMIEQLSATECVFHVYWRESSMHPWGRVNAAFVADMPWYQHREDYRFILAGESVWRIVRVLEVNRGDGAALELTLGQERV